MSKEREFAKNTIILLIGKFSTQFMSLLLIPIYTYFLATSDYGTVDLIQTYITLFVPLLTLKLDSAAFRFLIDERESESGKSKVITNISIILVISLILFSVFYFIAFNFIKMPYIKLTYINIFVLMISNIFLQFLRGVGNNKEYTISSILSAVATVVMNILLIVFFRRNADSILISSTIANLIVIIYIVLNMKISKYIKINFMDKKYLKELLKYSIPMIPNQLSWWIVNVSDRSMITYFLGAAFNGIYTISCKFSNIINTIFGIFNMSWQETASLHITDKNKEEFFSNMINKIFNLFSSVSLLMLAIIPIFFEAIIGKNYYEAYNYIPILVFGNIFNILISLIGGIYVALKKIKQIANTTIISAIINIILNVIFISKFGLYAAAFSTLIAYTTLAIYRYIDVQKYIKISINRKNFILTCLFFCIISITYHYNYMTTNIIILLFVIVYSILINKSILYDGINIVKEKIKIK